MANERTTTAAIVQLCARADVDINLGQCRELVEQAVGAGAEVVFLPEGFAFIGCDATLVSLGESFTEPGKILRECRALASENNIHLIAGGLPERASANRVYNTCVHFAPNGDIQARYRKIHMFDVQLKDGTVLRESSRTASGNQMVTSKLPFGTLGLSVCYDVRFPMLYQHLVDRGAIALAVPAAFTMTTGSDHWHTLLRARAIECQAFVVAPAQFGSHEYSNRHSFGHALILDPWGNTLAECTEAKPDVALAEIRPALAHQIRTQLPSLKHRRKLE